MRVSDLPRMKKYIICITKVKERTGLVDLREKSSLLCEEI